MELINKINHWISKLEDWILVAIVLFMVFMAFLQVILRNFFDMGIIWSEILLRHLVLWVGFIGASIATKNNKHINIDVLKRLHKGLTKRIINLIINLFASFVSGYLTYAAIRFVMDEKEFDTIIFNNIPAWPFQLIIPVGFALMSIRFIISGLNSLTEREGD
ncbi:MAG: TRAP transporter small permease [Calditrichaceae bacterium]|jgi:C4-dicarboxylate transporter, DctQ subunit